MCKNAVLFQNKQNWAPIIKKKKNQEVIAVSLILILESKTNNKTQLKIIQDIYI